MLSNLWNKHRWYKYFGVFFPTCTLDGEQVWALGSWFSVGVEGPRTPSGTQSWGRQLYDKAQGAWKEVIIWSKCIS